MGGAAASLVSAVTTAAGAGIGAASIFVFGAKNADCKDERAPQEPPTDDNG